MSSAILYLAIVAIWAVVLVPRWLRQPHAGMQPAEMHEEQPEPAGGEATEAPPAEDASPPAVSPPAAAAPATATAFTDGRRARVLRARRRTLFTLSLLTAGAAMLAAAHLAAWWVAVPPTVMLAGFLLLLREAARIDAERAARRLRATQDDAARDDAARDDAARDGAGRDRVTQRPEPDAAAAGAATHAARAAQPGEAGWHEAQQPAAAQAAEPGADIIDISARISDQLYDQYTDAEARAIGD